jgi:hypothetical protein
VHGSIPPEQYDSSGHCEQTRSVVALHWVVSYVPGAHSGVHGCGNMPVWQYEFSGHGPHALSVLFVHWLVSYSPFEQGGVHCLIPPMQK